jgi:hypothetical protein
MGLIRCAVREARVDSALHVGNIQRHQPPGFFWTVSLKPKSHVWLSVDWNDDELHLAGSLVTGTAGGFFAPGCNDTAKLPVKAL